MIDIACRRHEYLIGASMQISHDIILMETWLQDINWNRIMHLNYELLTAIFRGS